MKNKNKKLMIVVASLLVVIGVSFAYFVASNFIGGSGSSTDFTTATVQGSELRVEGNIEFNDLDIYPGHESVSSIKVTATGDNELIPYNVIWEGTNTLNTPLNYTIYKTSSEVDVSASCEQQKGVIDGAMMYYEECSITNLDSLGSSISSGTINSNETKVILAQDEFITSTASGTEMYYYVILEYPNLDEAQNSDIGGSFDGKVTVELSDAESDINIIAAYIEQEDGSYKETDDIPQSGYELNLDRSTCTNNTVLGWDSEDNRVYVENLNQSGTDCTLYYDEYNPYAGRDYILSHYGTVLTRSNFSTVVTNTTTGTIYKSLDSSQYDNDGEVYYFAGNPTDNWVQFGGFYWRIIKINGNGSIRMIYQGTAANTTGEGTQIGTNVFNALNNDNAYMGYMYTQNQVHGLGISSAIKGVLDTWYQNNLLSYADKLDGNAGFCGDRTPSTSNTSINNQGGTGTTITYYGGYIRLYTNKMPSLACSTDDLYTTSGSSNGNKALQYPIGLISMDEMSFAGEVSEITNSTFYLQTTLSYWTMTPSTMAFDGVRMYILKTNNSVSTAKTSAVHGVRPVINLKADVQLTGSGTTIDPYRIA